MRLIYIAPFLHPIGGLERTLTDKANYLVRKGHEIILLTYSQGHNQVFYHLDERVKCIDIDIPLFTIYKKPIYARPKAYFDKRHLFRERFKNVIDSFRPDVIVVTIPNTEDYIHDMISVANNIPVVIESHLASPFHLSSKPLTERLLYTLVPAITAIRKSVLLISLTEHDAESWREKGVSHVLVIPNPLTCYPSSLPAIEQAPNRIIAVGRLFHQKRFDRLIDAFSLIAGHYPDWYIDIFGDGILREGLKTHIARRGLVGRVNLNSATSHIYDEYKRSQFFVLSSDYEGFGLVIIEAMACGIPVVATDCPFGPSEIVEHGRTGLLSQMDVKDLAAKMEWMITHQSERRQMGRLAHDAVARYQQEVVMPEWERAYLSVISA